MSGHRLDVPELYRRLDDQRQALNLFWEDVATQCGLSPSTLTRMKDGRPPAADGFVSLLLWLHPGSDIAHLARPRDTP